MDMTEEINKEKRKNFKKLRQDLGLSSYKLSMRLGFVAPNTIDTWTQGRSIPTLSLYRTLELCEALDISLPELVEIFKQTEEEYKNKGKEEGQGDETEKITD